MKVLILSATTGGGHMRAANAMKDYILSRDHDAVVRIYDTIEYISPFINKGVTNGYVFFATKSPKLYGSMYKNSDKDTPFNKTVERTVTGLRNRLFPLVRDFGPDIVLTTHSFATELISALKIQEHFHFPVISILTDFAVHKTYLNKGVDAYILSSEEMVRQMVLRGIPEKLVHPFGIPIKEAFLTPFDREKAFEEEGLSPDLPVILIMAGSFGVTDVLKIYHKIVRSKADFQIILITGKNERLYETFEKYLSKIDINNALYDIQQDFPELNHPRHSRLKKPSKPTKLLFYTDCVEKYMKMSDLIVTKPGGLTVTESIATGLPMGIFKAIPGQEEQNADYLVRNGMAVRLAKDKTCTAAITRLISHPEILREMRKNVMKHNKGNSCEKLYDLMIELRSQYQQNA